MRRGTATLFAALDVATGEVIGRLHRRPGIQVATSWKKPHSKFSRLFSESKSQSGNIFDRYNSIFSYIIYWHVLYESQAVNSSLKCKFSLLAA